MSTDRTDPTLAYTTPFQLTKRIHRSVPSSLQPELPENSQNGKIVVITGGGTGIGAVSPHSIPSISIAKLTCEQAAAKVWVRAGAAGVVIAGRRKDKLDETVHELERFNKDGITKILAVATDLKVEAQVTHLFQQVNDTFGRPADVVIANAGMLSDAKLLAEDSVSNWWNVWVRTIAFRTSGK
jgi:NAD(P)-dependent dehydrogenase (short-subunit alcohol dehydrogenase family)